MMIDADGVDALSMRKLGQALGRDPMRVYRHTKSKAALLDAVAELVLEDLRVPATENGDWESAVRSAAHSFRDTALAHPRMIFLLLDRPMAVPPGGFRPSGLHWLEGLLTVFRVAGFRDQDALHAYRFFTAFISGHIIHEVQELMDDDAGSAADIRIGLDLLPEKQFPRVRALAPALAAHNGSLEFLLGLDIVLMGLRAQLLTAMTTTEIIENTDTGYLTK
jgi:AcrR family transcriptional regulator